MMSRAVLVLISDDVRSKAADWVRRLPVNTRVEFKEPKRTLPQNDRFWAMLTDISQQIEHCGRKYDTTRWKAIVLHALGQEVEFLPSLDGKTFIPLGMSSSDLSVAEMSAAIEWMFSEFIPRGVVFHEPEPKTWRRGAA